MDTFLSRKGSIVKESLSEYGSGWEYRTYAHVLDQTDSIIGIPSRVGNNGTAYDQAKNACYDDYETTDGRFLYGNGQMRDQISCRPDTGNAGNLYNFVASHMEDGQIIMPNSICPSGWKIPTYLEQDKSTPYLLKQVYRATAYSNDIDFRMQPLSFVRVGFYQGAEHVERERFGYYWLDAGQTGNINGAYIFTSGASWVSSYSTSGGKYIGYPLRCVAIFSSLHLPTFLLYY